MGKDGGKEGGTEVGGRQDADDRSQCQIDKEQGGVVHGGGGWGEIERVASA